MEPSGADPRAARYQRVALHALAALSDGDARPKTLHRLRTHLRRLQAYLELLDEHRRADITAHWISRLSRLRTLHVFERYMTRIRAPKSDLRNVRSRMRKARGTIEKKQIYSRIEGLVRDATFIPSPGIVDIHHRLARIRRVNSDALRDLAAKAAASPRRKRLHALRLKIKSIRYQEEWALADTPARSDLVTRLQHAQSVLGQYEDLAQFRTLSRKWGLTAHSKITKKWRTARKRARAIPGELASIADGLLSRSKPQISPLQWTPLTDQDSLI